MVKLLALLPLSSLFPLSSSSLSVSPPSSLLSLPSQYRAESFYARVKAFPLPVPRKTASADVKRHASTYLENIPSFVSNLDSQFAANVSRGVQEQFIGLADSTRALKRTAQVSRSISTGASKAQLQIGVAERPAGRASTRLVPPDIKEVSPPATPREVKVPGTFFPGLPQQLPSKSRAKLRSVRVQLGLMETYSALLISFIDSLTSQYEAAVAADGTVSVSDKEAAVAYGRSIQSLLTRELQQDIRSILARERLVNSLRFDSLNKRSVRSEIPGTYTGAFSDMTAGLRGDVTLRVTDIGAGSFQFAYESPLPIGNGNIPVSIEVPGTLDKKGYRFQGTPALLGTVDLRMNNRGTVKGSVSGITGSQARSLEMHGGFDARTDTITLDVRVELPGLSSGGHAHAEVIVVRAQ